MANRYSERVFAKVLFDIVTLEESTKKAELSSENDFLPAYDPEMATTEEPNHAFHLLSR